MARPKKIVETQNATQEVEMISQNEVYNVIEFAKAMSSSYLQQNIYTPDIVNARMKDMNMNPLVATEKAIQDALKDPKNNEKSLVGFSEFFGYTDMIYKRVLNYIALIPSFDLTYNCINAEKDKYKKPEYKRDLKIVTDFLDRFNYKAEFKSVMKQMLIQETYYCAFRNEGSKYVLQELPREYCKITGRSEFGFLFDFNMYWFLQPSVSINMYPDVFKTYYNNVFDKPSTNYNPANYLSNRTDTYIYYTQTSHEDGMWAFKFNPELAGNVPFLSPMFNDLVLAPQVRKLQMNKYMIEASKLLVGLVPLLKDNKSGNVKDMMGISPEVLGKFLGLLRQSISEVISLGAVPFEDIKAVEFDVNAHNIMEDFNKNLSSSSGINSRLLYGMDKPNALETMASINVDEMLSTYIYPYFENFLEYNINKLTTKYKFKFRFEGSEFTQNRKDRMDLLLPLMEKSIILPKKISAALGMDYADFERQLEEAKESGFADKLITIINASQMSGGNKNNTASKNGSITSDGGMSTAETGGNMNRDVVG